MTIQLVKYARKLIDDKVIFEEETFTLDILPCHPTYTETSVIFTAKDGGTISIPRTSLIPVTEEDLKKKGINLRTDLIGLPSYALADKNGIELFDFNSEQIRAKVGT